MKILLISSSPHKEKSKTLSLAKDILRGLSQEGADIETIHLDDLFVDKHMQSYLALDLYNLVYHYPIIFLHIVHSWCIQDILLLDVI